MSYQNNTIEALKKLYVAMGGTAADVENLNITPEMISAIADIYQGGGSALPEVTTDDNNKLLTVVEGAWNKADAPKELPTVTNTDNGKFLKVINGAWTKQTDFPVIYATFTYDESESAWTCDRTIEEVIGWINANKIAFARVQVAENTVAILPVTGLMYNEGDIFGVAFSAVAAADSADVREVTSAYVGYSALGIACSIETGYLSATDPNV